MQTTKNTHVKTNSELADLQSEGSQLLHALRDVVGDLLVRVELEGVDVVFKEPRGCRHQHVQRLHLLLVQNLKEVNVTFINVLKFLTFCIRIL